MELLEIKKRKAELEEDIRQVIDGFQKDTDTIVSSITLHNIEVESRCGYEKPLQNVVVSILI